MFDTDKYVQNIVKSLAIISSVYCDEIETKY